MTTLGIGTLKVKGTHILFSYPKFGTDRQIDRQTDKQTNRQTDRQKSTDRQRETDSDSKDRQTYVNQKTEKNR